MIFVIVGAILILLKFLEVGPVAAWSWWWVLAPLAMAIFWFEVLERVLGFDQRKKEHALHDKLREERIAKTFARDNRKRS
jgi:small Trp-rich protein